MPIYCKEIIDLGVGLRNLQGKDWLFDYIFPLLSMKSKYAYIFCVKGVNGGELPPPPPYFVRIEGAALLLAPTPTVC